MFINGSSKLHPNVLKHIAELVGEKYINAKVMEKLCNTNFSYDLKGVDQLRNFLLDNGISSTITETVINESVKFIYNSSNPYLIICKYIYTTRTRAAIKKHVNKYNNNKNHTYDLDSILVEFEQFVMRSPKEAYNFDDNNIIGFLMNTFTFFGKSEKGKKFIYSVLNTRGTQVSGADGEISLTQFVQNEVDNSKYNINFSKVVKDIYEASNALFTISNNTLYDLFTYHMNEELSNLENEVSEVFRGAFNSPSIGPIVVSDSVSFEGYTDFTRNTLKQRINVLNEMKGHVDNGLEFSQVGNLFRIIKDMDSKNLSSGNVGNLFKHKENKRHLDYSIFFTILKGIVSLNEFVKYIKINKIQLTQEDSILFRDPSYYKRYESLQDYITLRDITPSLIEEGNSVVDSVPYYTNDQCYDALVTSGYDLSSLFSVYKKEMDKNMSKYDIKSMKDEIMVHMEIIYRVYHTLVASVEKVRQAEVDPFSEEAFDFYFSLTDWLEEFILDFLHPEDKLLRDEIIAIKDLSYILRYFNLKLCYYEHIINLLGYVDKDFEYVALTIDKGLLELPKYISDVNDAAKLQCKTGISFHLDPNIKDYNIDSMGFKKQYYLMSSSIIQGHEKIFNFLFNWISEVTSKFNDYGITMQKKKLPRILREKLIALRGMEYNRVKNFEDYKSKFTIIDGFLFDKGKLLEFNRCYLHEKGYFLLIDNGCQILTITESQTFN